MNVNLQTLMWEFTEIAVNFFQSFICIYFAYFYLGTSKDRQTIILQSGCYFIALGFTISLMNHYLIFEHIFSIIYLAIIIIYAMTNLDGSISKKIFASVFPLMMCFGISAIVLNFMAMIFRVDVYTLITVDDSNRLITIILVQLVILYFTILSRKLFKNNRKQNIELTVTEWIFISVMLIVSTIIVICLNAISLETTSRTTMLYTVIALVCVVFINIFVCLLITTLGKKNNLLLQNQVYKLEKQYLHDYIESINFRQEITSKLRHDFSDNFTIVHTLLKDQKTQEAIVHIENNLQEIARSDSFVNTNNYVVNAIINSKLSKAKSLGVEVSCLSINNFSWISDMDLSRLLGNLLENGTCACELAIESNKKSSLHIKIIEDDYKYIFSVKNTIHSSVLKDNPSLATTKSDKNNHGYGIKIIKEIAEKYNGQVDFYEQDDFFYCNVMLFK